MAFKQEEISNKASHLQLYKGQDSKSAGRGSLSLTAVFTHSLAYRLAPWFLGPDLLYASI